MKTENDKIQIEIPVYYLLCVAVHGNMGTGELPELFKVWARTILNEKGYDAILKEKQKENLEKLRKGIQKF